MIKILILLKNSKTIGGVQSVTNHLAQIFSNEGFEVHILSNDILGKSLDGGIHYDNLPCLINNDLNNAENQKVIKEYISKNNISHVLIQNSVVSNINSIYVNGTKYFSTLHNMPYWGEYEYKKTIKKNLGFNKYLIKYLLYPVYFKKRFKRLVNKSLIEEVNNLDHYITLSPSYTIELKKNLGISNDKIISIANPIFPKRRPIPFEKKENILVYVGRLNDIQKKVHRLIKIWAEICHSFHQWKLIIIGDEDKQEGKDGGYKQYLQTLSKQLNCCNIEFVGHRDPEPYFQIAKINCLTSDFEGLPMSLIEGLYFGVVPISFNCCGGVKDIISGVGELIQPGDISGFAKRLSFLMNKEGELSKLSVQCIQRAQQYDVHEISNYWLKIFNEQ